ncbi:dihydrofolate reductase [Glutamicibacter uratoxydans]|uniref:Dihydrofolate reductase n=1 Tax=Glutamicibacter uratoxydans TaxID=43667 RepID=A0A4Y4DSZ3_GLUUR|nr:dihydrofolate reductase family protein [Glutamicibacter uratoxydans]GED06478.1 dihydrofolate reductase [Glutamicibacter uratoxydans]
MTSFKYYVGASIDGFIADRNGDAHWLQPFSQRAGVKAHFDQFFAGIGAVVIGGKTYENIARDVAEGKLEWAYGDKPVWVFTHHELPTVPGADLTFIRGEIGFWSRDIARSASVGDVWVVGGADLAGGFVQAGLLDELVLLTVPVVLGDGANIFGRGVSAQLAGLETENLGDDVFVSRYAVG